MMPGQKVWYRLTEENVQDVNFSRSLRALSKHETGPTDPIIKPDHPIFHGIPVEDGQIFPAEVIRCYSLYERDTDLHGSEDAIEWTKRTFSGVADLKVSLPGNDFLYVPKALEDKNSKEFSTNGNGVTVIPERGKFTCSSPAELLS